MSRRRTALAGTSLCLALVATLLLASAATAAWHYQFRKFIETSTTTSAGGLTTAKRCARSPIGEWRFRSVVEVDTVSSNEPKYQNVELEIRAAMPITSGFKPVHDVDVGWTAKLPKDPALAEFLSQHYDRLAKSYADFYEGMSVRWRPAKYKLDIRHNGLEYDGVPQLPPGELATPFKPQPGC